MRLRLPHPLLCRIEAAAEAAFPAECCGLLAGREMATGILVTAVHPAANVAVDPLTRFEVDPQVRFDLMRRLREGPDRIVGHYHSHPGSSAEPSSTDRARVHEPELLWFITALDGPRAAATRAFLWDAGSGEFRAIALIVDDHP